MEKKGPAAARPTGPNERPQKAERLLNSKKTYRKSQEANPLLELVKEQPPADIMAGGIISNLYGSSSYSLSTRRNISSTRIQFIASLPRI